MDFCESINFCHASKMETNYNSLRMVELRAFAREHGLWGYSRLRKPRLIAFLWDNIQPVPASPQSVRPRPPKPMRPPPPPPGGSFDPCESEQAFRGAYQSFRINGVSLT